jgi:RNA:NAD 2'-phosphotransferase (TPT1/KptA family)
MKISDIQPNNNLNNVIQKIMRLWPIKLPTTMFHVTKKSNLDSIKRHGIQTKRHGEIHGSMEISPPSPAIYIYF